MSDDGYLLENRQAGAGTRLDALAALFDPCTFQHFERLGVAPGWRCWEVGAGGRSVPAWLAGRVGRTGVVIATDIDLTWLAADRSADQLDGVVRVLPHDVGAEPPPATDLDLVHARLVLTHVPARLAALRTMVEALRPGGWLLVEDADPGLQPLACPDEHGPEQRLANRLRRDFRALMAARDADLAFGRTLPRLLRATGLREVAADGYFPIGGPRCVELERATIQQIRDQLVSHRLASDAELDRYLADLDAGRLPDLATPPLISAWGRRP